jgi:RHS repeat-associated protein
MHPVLYNDILPMSRLVQQRRPAHLAQTRSNIPAEKTTAIGLYYNRARYLVPALAQFDSEDPLRLPEYPVLPFANRLAWLRDNTDTHSAYQYGKSSPTKFIDPTGLRAGCIAEAAGAFGTCFGLGMAAMSPVELAITLSCSALGPEGFLACMGAAK